MPHCARRGRPQWSGPVYVATPQLLHAFGITASQVSPGADILSMRPGLSGITKMQLIYGNGAQDGIGPGGGNGPGSGSNRSRARRAAAWPTR